MEKVVEIEISHMLGRRNAEKGVSLGCNNFAASGNNAGIDGDASDTVPCCCYYNCCWYVKRIVVIDMFTCYLRTHTRTYVHMYT